MLAFPRLPRNLPVSDRRAGWLAGLISMICLVGTVTLSCYLARAQSDDEPAADEDWLEIRDYTNADGEKVDIAAPNSNTRNKFNAIIRNGATADAAEEKIFDEVLHFLIAEFTWKENRSLLPSKRWDLRRLYLIPAAARADALAVHDRINALLLDSMFKMATSERYHPAVRLNCMLVVGDLNKVEGKAAEKIEAVPLPESLKKLVSALGDEKLPDAVRIGAMVGIMRHVQARDGIAADDRKTLVQLATKMLQTKQSAKGSLSSGQVWLCRTSARLIGALALKSNDIASPALANSLVQVAADTDGSISCRCEAAYALGTFESKNITSDKAIEVSRALADLLVKVSSGPQSSASASDVPGVGDASKDDASKDENKSDQNDQQRDGDADAKAAKPSPPKATRRKAGGKADALTYELTCAQLAIEGVKIEGSSATRGVMASADASGKSFIEPLLAKIKEMLVISSNTKLSEKDVLAQMQTKGKELEAWIKQPDGAAEKAAQGNAAAKGGRPAAGDQAATKKDSTADAKSEQAGLKPN